MKKSIDTYKELMTALENSPITLNITQDLFDWLCKNTDYIRITKTKIKIKGSNTICIKEV